MKPNQKGTTIILVSIITFITIMVVAVYWGAIKNSMCNQFNLNKKDVQLTENSPSQEDCTSPLSLQEHYEKEAVRLFKEIDAWHVVAESPTHKIYMKGGSIFTVVLDKNLNLLLTPDQSCEINIGEDEKNEDGAFYYNASVGIEEQSAYKLITYDDSTNEFVQEVSTAGCLYEEGRTKLWTDENLKVVKCEVKIRSKLLGC